MCVCTEMEKKIWDLLKAKVLMSSAVTERLLELAEQLSLRADVPAFGLGEH